MISYGRQFIDRKDIQSVVKVLESDWLTQGPKVLEFEKALAEYCGSRYAAACSSGTAALHLAYLAAGFKKGDEIITTPNTFAATANMILAVGAKPIFCDIRLDTNNIDETKIEGLITSRTKAIAPVHFAGQPCQMEKINKIAGKYKLLVIEDACHALGARYKNGKIGNCEYAAMAVFSFHPVKSITTGEGGAVLTNNIKFYEKLISFRNHGIHKDSQGKNVMTAFGYNYRMADIQAALGISQLKKLDKFIKIRHKIVKWYLDELKDVRDIILPSALPENYSAWHIYIIRTKKPKDKPRLMAYLKTKGIAANFHYPAVYSHPFYRQNGYANLKQKNMDQYHNTCLTLPCHTGLTRVEIKYIAGSIKSFYAK